LNKLFRISYQIRVDYPLYLGKGRGRGAGCRGEKTPELEKKVIKADLVSLASREHRRTAISVEFFLLTFDF
jgi:hypothetical protein